MPLPNHMIGHLFQTQVNHSSSHIASNFLSGQEHNLVVYGAGDGIIPLKRTILDPLNIIPKIIVDKKYAVPEDDGCTKYWDISLFLEAYYSHKDVPIIISIGSSEVSADIAKLLKQEGFDRVIWAPDLYEYSLHHGKYTLAELRDQCFQEKERIFKAYGLLSDQYSQEVFAAILTRYLTARPHPVPSLPFDNQYLANDLPVQLTIDTYICCGAYDGDSIRKLIQIHPSISAIYAFEPDPSNYRRLCQYIAGDHSLSHCQTHCIPSGLYSETKMELFSASNGLSTTIDTNGDTYLPLVALDDYFHNISPSYITMDVEGAELAALTGASTLISSTKPCLAISVYHNPDHLWSVLLYLKELVDDYHFYLRNYSGHAYESVLYAIP
jgi:FkbM family methyltransferase